MKIMKKITAVFAAAAIMSAAAFPAAAEDRIMLTVMGDSIATGYGLADYTAENPYAAAGSFANITAAALGAEAEKDFFNIAVNGATTDDMNALLEKADTADKLAMSDKIVISIGGNDLLQPMISQLGKAVIMQADAAEELGVEIDGSSMTALFGSFSALLEADTAGTVMQNILDYLAGDESKAIFTAAGQAYQEKILSALKTVYQYNPNAEVYLLTLYNPFRGVPGMSQLADVGDTVIKLINEGVYNAQAALAEDGFTLNVVDAASAINLNPIMLTNISKLDIHPNASGHKIISTLLADAMGLTPAAESDEPEITLPEEEPALPITEATAAAEKTPDTETANPDTGNTSAAAAAIFCAAAFGVGIFTAKRKK